MLQENSGPGESSLNWVAAPRAALPRPIALVLPAVSRSQAGPGLGIRGAPGRGRFSCPERPRPGPMAGGSPARAGGALLGRRGPQSQTFPEARAGDMHPACGLIGELPPDCFNMPMHSYINLHQAVVLNVRVNFIPASTQGSRSFTALPVPHSSPRGTLEPHMEPQ